MITPRSYVPHPRRRLLAAVLIAAAIPGVAQAQGWPSERYPGPAQVREAKRFARAAPGAVAFAVLDPAGGPRGHEASRRFSSASVSKALLLAAELRRLRAAGDRLDGTTRSLLESMIRFSDNDAAGSIYVRVGDGGLEQVARRAGMRSFQVVPGYWGGAQVTGADLARFFLRLERNLVGPHRGFAKRLLARVTSSQRWGIPEAAGRGWTVYFKGGWRPPQAEETSGPVTHQAALLRHRSGRRVAIAILTDQSPGGSTYETLEGITRRLLAKPPAPRRWPAP